MPDLYGPFDNSSWSQGQWYRYAPTWAPSGVVGSAAAATSASAGPLGLTFSGLDLTLSLGRAWVYGAGYERTSTPWTGTVPVNTSSNPRIDALVLRRDLAAKTVLPTILQGTPAASPVAPARSSDELGQWDLPLFSWITPPNSGSPINTVADMRVWVDTQGSNYAVASAGGAQIKAYGSMATTQMTPAGPSVYGRVIGGLNFSPSLLPNRIYEYSVSAWGPETGGATLLMQARALAGSTAPTPSTGTIIGGASVRVDTAAVPSAVLAGTFTVGTVGVYTISPFIASSVTAGFQVQTSTPAPAIVAVLRDMGPSAGIVGTTPIAVP